MMEGPQAKIFSLLQPPMYYRDLTFLLGGFGFLLLAEHLPIRKEFLLGREYHGFNKLLSLEFLGHTGDLIAFLVASYFVGLFLSIVGKIIFELALSFYKVITDRPLDRTKIGTNFKGALAKRERHYEETKMERLRYLYNNPLVMEEYHRIIYQGLNLRIIFAAGFLFSVSCSFWFLLPTCVFMGLLVKVDEGIESMRQGIIEDIQRGKEAESALGRTRSKKKKYGKNDY